MPIVIDQDPDRARVREAIAAGAAGVDAIMRHTGLPLRAVLRVLHTLERYS
jgi:DNA-binding IclR family transcriptional regulator